MKKHSVKERQKKTRKQAFWAVLFCVAVMAANYHGPTQQIIHRLFSWGLSSVYIGVDFPRHVAQKLQRYWTEQDQLIKENNALHAENQLLQARVHALSHLIREHQTTRLWIQRLQAKHMLVARFLNAHLLAVNLSPFRHSMLIDQGEKEGVFMGQPVIDGQGIIGHVFQVNPHNSQVLLASDAAFAIPVILGSTAQRAVAVGYGERGYAQLREVPYNAAVTVGESVISSGLGSRYPAGYPVGRVVTVQRLAHHVFAYVRIKLSAKFTQGAQVLLIWPKRKG